MNFNDYQIQAETTADYPSRTTKDSLTYLGMGLAGEAGEVANKLKKYLRGDYILDIKRALDLVYEIGDCLWYISEIARSLDFSLEEVAELNIEKLEKRKEQQTIKGDGDNR